MDAGVPETEVGIFVKEIPQQKNHKNSQAGSNNDIAGGYEEDGEEEESANHGLTEEFFLVFADFQGQKATAQV
jgi:hypothetical protein